MCWGFYLKSWIEALNTVGVDQSLELRDLEKVFYPLAIRVKVVALVQSSFAPSTQLASTKVSSLASSDKASAAPLTSSKKEVLVSNQTSPSVSHPSIEGQNFQRGRKGERARRAEERVAEVGTMLRF